MRALRPVLAVVCGCALAWLGTVEPVHSQATMNKAELAKWDACQRTWQSRTARCLRAASDVRVLADLNVRTGQPRKRRYSPACEEKRAAGLRACAGDGVYCRIDSERC